MKRTTKKLSGISLRLFLRRFYEGYEEIDASLARRLSEDSANALSSVRIRRIAWRDWRHGQPASRVVRPATATDAPAPAETNQPVDASHDQIAPGVAPFDPYSIGLVPIYQREGADGLASRLSEITSLANLRKMARAQQVALPAELREPDADIEAVRSAIVDAVGRRIANRRAAAG